MSNLKFLALPLVLALAACATQPSEEESRGGVGRQSMRCDDGTNSTSIPCEVRISVVGGKVTFAPQELHVHFGPAIITWVLADPGYEFVPALGDGIRFKHVDRDGGPFDSGGLVEANSRTRALVPTLRRSTVYRWFDLNPALPDGTAYMRYEYGIVFHSAEGKEFHTDPPVVNHGNH
jgi:hypothetical protein